MESEGKEAKQYSREHRGRWGMEFCILPPRPPEKNQEFRNQPPAPAQNRRRNSSQAWDKVLSDCGGSRPGCRIGSKGNPYDAGGRRGSHWGSSGRQSPCVVSIQARGSYAGATEELETEETSVRDVVEASEPSSTFLPNSCSMQLRNCRKKTREGESKGVNRHEGRDFLSAHLISCAAA